MLAPSLLSWFTCILILELVSSKHTLQMLGVALLLVLDLVMLLSVFELDILAVLVASIYAAVFLFLNLLQFHLGTGVQATAISRQKGYRGSLLGGLVLALSLAGALSLFTSNGQRAAEDYLVWQDLSLTSSVGLTLSGDLLHWFFYKLFIFEAVALNVYIFLGLALALALLGLADRWGKAPNSRSTTGSRLRVIKQLRRQSRRRNASQIRFVI